MNKIKYIIAIIINIIISVFCLYYIWGWITINDIKKDCKKRNIDFDEEIYNIIPSSVSCQKKSSPESIGFQVHESNEKNIYRRYWVGIYRYEYSSENSESTQDSFSQKSIDFLYPFVVLTDNNLNLGLCFSIGFITSIALVIIKYIKNQKQGLMFLYLRPIVGGIVSYLLLLVILSGGIIFFREIGDINGFSVGIVAIFGGVKCESLEAILNKLLNKNYNEEHSDKK